jgi:hypothetical protein
MTPTSLKEGKFLKGEKDKKAFVYLSMLIALLLEPVVFDIWALTPACLQSIGCSILIWVWWVLATESLEWFFEQCDNKGETK